MRLLLAAASGGLFGLGLMISGMTDPRKVIGWLDIFGAWDPTLAFVLGGAILPMVVAWRLTEGRKPVLGGTFPAQPDPVLDHRLIVGSALFGVGWGLAGLCPGPAMASIGYGNWQVWLFIIAMISGMAIAPAARAALDASIAKVYGTPMQINRLSPAYAVSAQITTDDVPTLKAAGFVTVICNRPDHEIPPVHQADAIRMAVEAAGMLFIDNPVQGGTLGEEAVPIQAEAMANAAGPVFAYCRSGNRSSVVWALAMAPEMPVDEILSACLQAGYDLSGLRPYLDAAAERG